MLNPPTNYPFAPVDEAFQLNPVHTISEKQKQIDQMVCRRQMVSMQGEFDLLFLPTTVMFWGFWEVVLFRAIETHIVGCHHMEEDFFSDFQILVHLVVKTKREEQLDIAVCLPKEEQYVLVW